MADPYAPPVSRYVVASENAIPCEQHVAPPDPIRITCYGEASQTWLDWHVSLGNDRSGGEELEGSETLTERSLMDMPWGDT